MTHEEALTTRTQTTTGNGVRALFLANLADTPWILRGTEYAAEKAFVLEFISLGPFTPKLEHAATRLRADLHVVLAAMKHNGTDLVFAARELRSDHEVVLAAVNNNGGALEYASDELRSDREVVLAAVNSDGMTLKYASIGLLNCTTNTSIAFVQAALQMIRHKRGSFLNFHYHDLWMVLPSLKAALVVLCQELNEVATLKVSQFRDESAVVFGRRWVSELHETGWCLGQACMYADVPDEAQRAIEQFCEFPAEYQTANRFLTYSRIIHYALLVNYNMRPPEDLPDLNWWQFLSGLE